MTDIIEMISPEEFDLRGRASDNIDIAGKRASLSGLNSILCDIDGVIDGVFFLPEGGLQNKVSRLVAFVVAPEADLEKIRQALRQSVDPAFMPRQIYLVPSLPRLETGKLPHAALSDLAARMKAGGA